MQTNVKAPAAESAPRVLSQFELAEKLWQMAEQVNVYDAENAIEHAKAAVARAEARLEWEGAKMLRVMRAKSIEEAEAILAETRVDVNLKKLCQKAKGWKALQEKGATDDEIKKLLVAGWPANDYTSNLPRCQKGWNENPEAWVDPDKSPRGNAHLQGGKLIEAVRRVMNIPKPAAPKPTASSAKSTTAAKPAKKKPAPAKKKAAAPLLDDDDLADAAPPAKAGVGRHSQTFGQWAATLRGINNGIDLPVNLETKASPTVKEAFLLEQFRAGKRPAEARDAWRQQEAAAKSQTAPPAGSDEEEHELASVAALRHRQTPMPDHDEQEDDEEDAGDDLEEVLEPAPPEPQGKREVYACTLGREGADVVITAALCGDGRYRAGHYTRFHPEFADRDFARLISPDRPGLESEAYAIRTEASVVAEKVRKLIGELPKADKPRIRPVLQAIETFITHNPACRLPAAQGAA